MTTPHEWSCDRCPFSIGAIWVYRIQAHQLEHETLDQLYMDDLEKARAEAKAWKARFYEHVYDTEGPARAHYLIGKYEKRISHA